MMIFLILFLLGFTPTIAQADDARTEESTIKDNIYTQPLSYREKPMGFEEHPSGWREKPLGFREKPVQWTDKPSGFEEKIPNTLDQPRGFGASPPNFIDKEKHPQVNTRADYVLTPETHPLADNDESNRITPETHPDATTVTSVAEKKDNESETALLSDPDKKLAELTIEEKTKE